MRKYIVLPLLFILISVGSRAQEVMLPLQVNAALKPLPGQSAFIREKSAAPLKLPFFDDFSYKSVYPDQSKWEDRNVFVNRTFGPEPPSLGMATFDILDDTGAVYYFAASTPFIADYLTSRPLRLDSVFGSSPHPSDSADSAYLSFYYQPQGFGNAPDAEDSLILEFFTSSDSTWHKVWGDSGITYNDFHTLYNKPFRLVTIPVLDPIYLKPDFRFRFKNYGSMANNNLPSWQSNMDQWNIDYVMLDFGRSKTDNTYPDITFIEGAESMLKNYMQMPRRQYDPSELKDTFLVNISNLDSTYHNIGYHYIVNQLNGAWSSPLYFGGFYDVNPFITNGYDDYSWHRKPAVNFTLPAMSNDSTSFMITHRLDTNNTSGFTRRDSMFLVNDTVQYRQEFYNYYAYDDGTAEAGYGLIGVGARLAYEFTLNQADTLGAVKMYFNQTYTLPDSRYFYIMVWTSLNEEPVYKSKRTRPFTTDSLNEFYTYYITDATVILTGKFYVGWQQITEEVLNIGFDKNTNKSNRMFYNTEGTWENSGFEGSLMMRPVMGTAGHSAKLKKPDGINDLIVTVYPNPVYKDINNGDILTVDIPDKYKLLDPENTMTIEVFNYMGQKVIESPYMKKLRIADLQAGYYFLRLNSFSTSESNTTRFVIMR